MILTLAALAGLALASTATGIIKIYGDCPTAQPGLAICTYAETTNGEFASGSPRVPINKTIILQEADLPAGGVNPTNTSSSGPRTATPSRRRL